MDPMMANGIMELVGKAFDTATSITGTVVNGKVQQSTIQANAQITTNATTEKGKTSRTVLITAGAVAAVALIVVVGLKVTIKH